MTNLNKCCKYLIDRGSLYVDIADDYRLRVRYVQEGENVEDPGGFESLIADHCPICGLRLPLNEGRDWTAASLYNRKFEDDNEV